MEQYFKISNIHCAGQYDFNINALGVIYTVGFDDIIYKTQINGQTDVEKRFDLMDDQHHSKCIGVHPYKKDMIVIGGENKKVCMFEQDNFESPQQLLQTQGNIESIQFSKTGNLIGIAALEPSAIIYDFRSKKVMKCRPGHQDQILSIFFSPNEKFICSMSINGQLRIYKIEEKVDPQLVFSQKISDEIDIYENLQRLKGCYNDKGNILALPGKTNLQLIEYLNHKYILTQNQKIRHEKQLNACLWQNDNILITSGLDRNIIIWNFQSSQKITVINNLSFIKMVRYDDIFFAINDTGNLYQFTRPDLFKIQEIKKQTKNEEQKQLIQQSAQQSVQDSLVSLQDLAQYKKKIKSKAHVLITNVPQPPLSKITEYYRNHRIIYYNEIGIIKEKIDGENKIIEVQYHFQPEKNKSLFTNKSYKYFEIQKNLIAYANQSEYGIVGEYQWQNKSNDIEGICIGTSWLAIINQQFIKICDLRGNQLQAISVDKPFVTFKGYQNILVLVFHESPPILGSQRLRIKIFEISLEGVIEMEQSFLPLKPGSMLKSFGISPEGLIYSEDSSGKIRCWFLQKNEWMLVYDPQNTNQKYRFISIVNYQILKFILDQEINFPTIEPKCALKKVKICVPTLNSSNEIYINHSKNIKYGQILWKKNILSHQRFRNKLWYKYKVSRNLKNPQFELSNTILSQNQIKAKQTSLENQFVFLIKNYINKQEIQKAFISVKSFVQTRKTAQRMAQIFEELGARKLSIQIQIYFDQKFKEKQYEDFIKNKYEVLKLDLEKKIQLNMKKHQHIQKEKNIEQPPVTPFIQKIPIQSNKVYKILKSTHIPYEDQKPTQIINPFAKKQLMDPAEKFKKQFQARIQRSTINFKKNKQSLKQEMKLKENELKKKK